jgi:hypothetical protein
VIHLNISQHYSAQTTEVDKCAGMLGHKVGHIFQHVLGFSHNASFMGWPSKISLAVMTSARGTTLPGRAVHAFNCSIATTPTCACVPRPVSLAPPANTMSLQAVRACSAQRYGAKSAARQQQPRAHRKPCLSSSRRGSWAVRSSPEDGAPSVATRADTPAAAETSADQAPAPATTPSAASEPANGPAIIQGSKTALATGIISVVIGVAYLALVAFLDMRGGEMLPPPPEAYLP